MNRNNYCVYVHHNNINGKRYVGVTNNPKHRWCKKGKYYAGCPHFERAIKKYGWDNFTHYYLFTDLTFEEADLIEKEFIKKYKTQDEKFGYNATEGGINAPTMLGKHFSDEHKEKIRQSKLGRLNPQSKSVRCIDTNEVFATLTEAAKNKGVLKSKISLCCQGKATHTHGLHWEYVNMRGN